MVGASCPATAVDRFADPAKIVPHSIACRAQRIFKIAPAVDCDARIVLPLVRVSDLMLRASISQGALALVGAVIQSRVSMDRLNSSTILTAIWRARAFASGGRYRSTYSCPSASPSSASVAMTHRCTGDAALGHRSGLFHRTQSSPFQTEPPALVRFAGWSSCQRR